jgi:hypothetical protein
MKNKNALYALLFVTVITLMVSVPVTAATLTPSNSWIGSSSTVGSGITRTSSISNLGIYAYSSSSTGGLAIINIDSSLGGSYFYATSGVYHGVSIRWYCKGIHQSIAGTLQFKYTIQKSGGSQVASKTYTIPTVSWTSGYTLSHSLGFTAPSTGNYFVTAEIYLLRNTYSSFIKTDFYSGSYYISMTSVTIRAFDA